MATAQPGSPLLSRQRRPRRATYWSRSPLRSPASLASPLRAYQLLPSPHRSPIPAFLLSPRNPSVAEDHGMSELHDMFPGSSPLPALFADDRAPSIEDDLAELCGIFAHEAPNDLPFGPSGDLSNLPDFTNLSSPSPQRRLFPHTPPRFHASPCSAAQWAHDSSSDPLMWPALISSSNPKRPSLPDDSALQPHVTHQLEDGRTRMQSNMNSPAFELSAASLVAPSDGTPSSHPPLPAVMRRARSPQHLGVCGVLQHAQPFTEDPHTALRCAGPTHGREEPSQANGTRGWTVKCEEDMDEIALGADDFEGMADGPARACRSGGDGTEPRGWWSNAKVLEVKQVEEAAAMEADNTTTSAVLEDCDGGGDQAVSSLSHTPARQPDSARASDKQNDRAVHNNSKSGGRGQQALRKASSKTAKGKKTARRAKETVSQQGGTRSSGFRGVTKHRRSGRWEAHVWVKERQKQIYLGGYTTEDSAAEAYDVAVLKCKGRDAATNFAPERYADLLACMHHISLEELILAVRRQSQGFSRGSSSYRGVTNHPSGRWEARIGIPGSKHVYLGLYSGEDDAACAYDEAVVRLRGATAVTNYPLSQYAAALEQHSAMMQAGKPFADIVHHPSYEAFIKSGELFDPNAVPEAAYGGHSHRTCGAAVRRSGRTRRPSKLCSDEWDQDELAE